MRQAIPWVIAAGCIGVTIGVVLRSPTQPSSTASAPTPLAQQQTIPPGASIEGKVVHEFEDESKMSDFTSLWQQRQGILLRMSLLQSYWNNEEASLSKFHEKMKTDYSLDTANKAYVLDGDRRALIEREKPPAGSEAGAPAAAPAEQKIALSFANDAEMKSFGDIWQQRQVIGIRMAVLQNLWNEEQKRLVGINDQLTKEFNVDPSKTYFLDGQRRRLIERETESASQLSGPRANASVQAAPQSTTTPAPATPAQPAASAQTAPHPSSR